MYRFHLVSVWLFDKQAERLCDAVKRPQVVLRAACHADFVVEVIVVGHSLLGQGDGQTPKHQRY